MYRIKVMHLIDGKSDRNIKEKYSELCMEHAVNKYMKVIKDKLEENLPCHVILDETIYPENKKKFYKTNCNV